MNLDPLLSLIGSVEAPKGFDQVYGRSKIHPHRPITGMTLKEVRDWQQRSVEAGSESSAAGRFQIIRRTLDRLVATGAASWGDLFNKETQIRLAIALMKGRGLNDFVAGKLSAKAFANNLAKEWASMPVVTPIQGRWRRVMPGETYYAGDGLNKALVPPDEVLAAIRQIPERLSLWARFWTWLQDVIAMIHRT